VTKTFWIKRGGLERIDYDSNYNIYWGVDGTLRSWRIDEGLEVDLKNKFSLGVDYTAKYKLNEKKFWNNETEQDARVVYGENRSTIIPWPGRCRGGLRRPQTGRASRSRRIRS